MQQRWRSRAKKCSASPRAQPIEEALTELTVSLYLKHCLLADEACRKGDSSLMVEARPSFPADVMSPDSLKELVNHYPRVAITGAPGCGKTALALQATAYATVLHGEDFIRDGWAGSSEQLAHAAADLQGPLIVEGIQVAPALVKGLGVDALVVMPAKYTLTNAQRVIWKGCEAMLRDLERAGRLPYVFFGARWCSAG